MHLLCSVPGRFCIFYSEGLKMVNFAVVRFWTCKVGSHKCTIHPVQWRGWHFWVNWPIPLFLLPTLWTEGVKNQLFGQYHCNDTLNPQTHKCSIRNMSTVNWQVSGTRVFHVRKSEQQNRCVFIWCGASWAHHWPHSNWHFQA